VHESVRLQVLRIAWKPYEDVFGSDMEVEAGADNKSNKSNAKSDHLDCFTSALYRIFVRQLATINRRTSTHP
jgi:hypothetical protein